MNIKEQEKICERIEKLNKNEIIELFLHFHDFNTMEQFVVDYYCNESYEILEEDIKRVLG